MDSLFLEQNNICDYSFLLGIHESSEDDENVLIE